MTALADEKYVAFTTFRKDGTPKSTPVWIVGTSDGRLAFTTASTSWKVRRLANDPRITLQPSDSRGRVRAGSTEFTGTAVAAPDEFARTWDLVQAKYGVVARAIKLLGRVGGLFGREMASDTAVVITLEGSSNQDS